MEQEIRAGLWAQAEADYAAFHKKLCPDTAYPILGVRLPKQRAIARQAAKGDWQGLLDQWLPEAYEEIMIYGLVIAYAKAPLAEKLDRLRALLPKLDCWALTDSIAPTFRFKENELPEVWDFAQGCLESPLCYTRRFGLILMLDYFLTPAYLPKVCEAVQNLRDDRYYVRMAAAWLVAEIAAKDYEAALAIIKSGKLDDFTHNKAIAKARESYRLSPAQKEELKKLKRKQEKA